MASFFRRDDATTSEPRTATPLRFAVVRAPHRAVLRDSYTGRVYEVRELPDDGTDAYDGAEVVQDGLRMREAICARANLGAEHDALCLGLRRYLDGEVHAYGVTQGAE